MQGAEIYYYNLTQLSGERVVYFRSTDVEQRNYRRLLWSVPDEFFYRWYLGDTVVVVDASTNRRGSKVIRIFIPVLKDFLNKIYFNLEPVNRYLFHHYQTALEVYHSDTQLRTRYKFWRGKIKCINLKGISIYVPKEPNPLTK